MWRGAGTTEPPPSSVGCLSTEPPARGDRDDRDDTHWAEDYRRGGGGGGNEQRARGDARAPLHLREAADELHLMTHHRSNRRKGKGEGNGKGEGGSERESGNGRGNGNGKGGGDGDEQGEKSRSS